VLLCAIGAWIASLRGSCENSDTLIASDIDRADHEVEPLMQPGSQQSNHWRVATSIEHSSQQWLGWEDVYYPSDPRLLTVLNRTEIDNARWGDVTHDYSTFYDIELVGASKRDWFYLVGTADNQDVVIERWKKKQVNQGGGSGPPVFIRSELYRGAGLGTIRALGIDPGNRFLILVHGQPALLSKLTIGSGNPISTLYTEAVIPDLGMVGAIFVRLHESGSRIWTLERFPLSSTRTLLFDDNNDGSIDGVEAAVPYAYYNDYYPPETFTNDFVHWQE
jgi:hypothetical protein